MRCRSPLSTSCPSMTTLAVGPLIWLALLAALPAASNAQAQTPASGSFCPAQVLITPCRCYQRGVDIQVWCSHSDLPRVLAGLRALAQTVRSPIDELILENNQLPSLPARFFAPLQILRLMLRHNGIERVSAGWLSDLAPHLQEVYVVERQLRNVPADSLQGLLRLEAVTIESEHLKRVPRFAGLPRLKYVRVESGSLIELLPGAFRDLPTLQTVYVTGSTHLNRLEAGVFENLPRLEQLHLQRNGISYLHGKALQRLPRLAALDLSDNAISDARMVGRAIRQLARLERCTLASNHITSLAAGSFADLPQLQELRLQHNAIAEVLAGAFVNTPRLRLLHLEGNFVQRIHAEAFVQLAGQSVEYVHVQNNELERAEELRVLLDALPRLKFLDASGNRLKAITVGALRNHDALEQLYLDHNRIEHIERDAFGIMPGLRELRLKNNSLSNALDFPIWNLPGLKGLDLSANRFARLDAQLLVGVPSLRHLDVSANRIAAISSGAFDATPLLETINVSYNQLSTIHPSTLNRLDRLFELDASHNELRDFVPGMPRSVERIHLGGNHIATLAPAGGKAMNLPHLTWLELADNELYRVPRMSMQYLGKLRYLGLAANRLQTVDELSLVGLKELEQLNLQDNKLMALHENAFEALKGLRVLNVRGNRLELLVDRQLASLEQLRHLDVSQNNIVEMAGQVFGTTRQLEYIDLSQNRLKELPASLTGMTELRTLDISNNQLATIAVDMFSSLGRLEELRVANNRVRTLQRGALRGLPHLEYLDLSSNELAVIEPNAIRNLPQLKELVLADNQLEELGDRVCEDLPNLQAVHLQHNKLQHLSSATFFRSPSIVYLNVSLNNFASLQHIGIAGLRNVEVLDATGNAIRRLSTSDLAGLDWLVELKLDDNRICRVHGEPFQSMPRLRVLTMRNNRISRVAESAFRSVRSNLGVFDLDGNPLRCTCELLWLRSWYRETNSLTRFPGPRCSDGSMLRDLPVTQADCQQQLQLAGLRAGSGQPTSANAIPPLTNEHGDSYGQLLAAAGGPTDECELAADADAAAESEIGTNGLGDGVLSPGLSAGDSKYFNDRYIDYVANETGTDHELLVATAHLPPRSNVSSSHPLLNLNNTLLNYNKHKLDQQYLQQHASSPLSKFTFFGMPLPSLNMGNLWNFGRDAKTRSVTGTRGTPRLQVYKPEELDFYTFLSRQNESARAKILNSAPTGSGHRTPHYFNNGEVPPSGPPSPTSPQPVTVDPYGHIYRPPFRTAFAQPVDVERGGFRPILPGEGNFRPMLDTSVDAMPADDHHHRHHDDGGAENLAPSNSDRVLIGGPQTVEPANELAPEDGQPVAEQATIRYDIVVAHTENNDRWPTAPTTTAERYATRRPAAQIVVSSSTDDELSAVAAGVDKQTVGSSPPKTFVKKQTVPRETTMSIPTTATVMMETTMTTPTITAPAATTTTQTTTTTTTARTLTPAVTIIPYNPWTTRHPQRSPSSLSSSSSSLSALVAPGAQLSNFRSPPGRSTIVKVSTPLPPTAQLKADAAELRPQTVAPPLAQASGNFSESNAALLPNEPMFPMLRPIKDGKDMSWYYRNYNQSAASFNYADIREQFRPQLEPINGGGSSRPDWMVLQILVMIVTTVLLI